MSITKEAKQKYLENQDHCPYCGSKSITRNSVGIVASDGSYISNDVKCLHCLKDWADICTLVDVAEYE